MNLNNTIRHIVCLVILTVAGVGVVRANPADGTCRTLLNNDWLFRLGHAGDMERDFGHGTEYFTYLTKARSNNGSTAPVMPRFDDSDWQHVSLPHDWVVDLPYSPKASHSHGYKQVGWRWPQTSVGWYRKHFTVPKEAQGGQVWIEFEGIYRDAQVFCNGFYLGSQQSGYTSHMYCLTPYLEYGGENLITVRVDASLEEGWYYEGAGIYRNVYLHQTGPVALKPYSLCVGPEGGVTFETVCQGDESRVTSRVTLLDAEGHEVVHPTRRWSPADPYLYTARVQLLYDGRPSAEYRQRFGLRDIEFRPDSGLLLNGRRTMLKGCDLHLDAAGVGTALPDSLWRYRLERLKAWGFNAIRCSHNPASPAMLDLCDELGLMVIDENRQFGIGEEQKEQLRDMIRRDRNHPCVILWSMGNEEWAVEWSPLGTAIATELTRTAHAADPTRPTTYAASGGPAPNRGVDVMGYNYIVQNNIRALHEEFPHRSGVGTEETSGCGTRGKYRTDDAEGWMLSHNRHGVDVMGLGGEPVNTEGYRLNDEGRLLNVIEQGWKYYDRHPGLAGLFYWTGFDYRGEPNPMAWPATGSQFGILDYCGFPKDEAYYLKSVFTDEPVLHLSPHWNSPVPEGDSIEVWAYTNCERVTLKVNGKNLGTQRAERGGHLAWKTVYRPGRLEATGWRQGRKVTCVVETSGRAERAVLTPSKRTLRRDGQDVVVIDISMVDSRGRLVPDADVPLRVSVENACLLGWGNGNPGFKAVERPQGEAFGARTVRDFPITTFSGQAQVIVRSISGVSDPVTVKIDNEELIIR